ncbi:hypothetical protein ACXYTP_21715 [Tsukamurella ocularis]
MTPAIAVKITDTEKAQAVISKAEGRAKARWISADELPGIAERAEKRLAFLPKRLWAGTEVTFTEAGPYASSYGNSAAATSVTLRRRSADWVLVSAARVGVHPGDKARLTVVLPAEIGEEARERALALMKVRVAPAAAER